MVRNMLHFTSSHARRLFCSSLAVLILGGMVRPLVAAEIPTPSFEYDENRWPYPLHGEVKQRLYELAEQYPDLARVHNIGKSVGGYDLLVMELGNSKTGPGVSKPGIWMDGNLHPDELPGRRYLRYFIEKVLARYGKDPEVTRLMDSRTFYVMSILNPDAGDRALTKHPAWPGYDAQQQEGRDLNGDGFITRMRWKENPDDPRYQQLLEGLDPGSSESRSAYFRIRGADGEREATDFNRNWSAEWRPEEPGGGPFPFSLPETYAVAKFITSHKNIFFVYSIHTGGGNKSYMVRPPFNHPYQTMHQEDNDFYIRTGAMWSVYSDGGITENNYYSYQFTAGRATAGGGQLGYTATMAGFFGDWAYDHQGLHSLTPEVSGVGRDYDGNGYLTRDETERWVREQGFGEMFRLPWKPFKHPVLGDIEIGGSMRELPQALGPSLLFYSEAQYRLMLHVADYAPQVEVREIRTQDLGGGQFRVSAVLQNTGWLSTYVTRKALERRKDFPVVVEIAVRGGRLVEGKSKSLAGHLLGKLSFIGEWSGSPGFGRDDDNIDPSMKIVEWTVKADGDEPPQVTVSAWAHKAGQDKKTIALVP